MYTMSDYTVWILVLLAGILLGVFFFGGLWWTTKRGIVSKSPVIWFFGSLIIRLSITLATIYFISHNHWERMLICLAGFIIARTLLIKVTKPMVINKVG